MKYMGSKRSMLENGLGELIIRHAKDVGRVFDPFCGSGAVAWFAAENTSRAVIASDLQQYAIVLAGAVVMRTAILSTEDLIAQWFAGAKSCLSEWSAYKEAAIFDMSNWEADPKHTVGIARHLCATETPETTVFRAYGGHYYSPLQAVTLDALWMALPLNEPERTVALAALISTASACAASPGHTAQPFQPTEKASRYLFDSWRRDPFHYCRLHVNDISPRHAQHVGRAVVRDALSQADDVQEGDLVILDPPYSSVHYSRFYHVLETVAKGFCGTVDGIGRYPAATLRPRSQFSLKTSSGGALSKLLQTLALRKASVILTFPVGYSSNGLTGSMVSETAERYFFIQEQTVKGRFSTLGGNSHHRPARQQSEELILVLKPRSAS